MKTLLALLSALATSHAIAGEPLVTDDASILERGVCQVESWHRWSTGGAHEGWLLPACSVTSWLELTAGGARYRDPDVGGHSLFLLQAKSVFAADPDGRWSIGAVVGIGRDGGHEERGRAFHQSSALGLVSFAALDNTLRVHANAGVAYSRGDYRTAAWGTAIEFDFRDDWTAMAEIFRDAPGRPSYQIGLRYLLVTDRVELFLSGGDRFGGSGDWFAKFGVRFQSWKLF
ncbi:MAG TPA: hypothetical protein VNE58_17080 [Casimicrobiaceae bacterium]|nr:hypothetical protein [Casimicrobiaceae bacterium]